MVRETSPKQYYPNIMVLQTETPEASSGIWVLIREQIALGATMSYTSSVSLQLNNWRDGVRSVQGQFTSLCADGCGPDQ